MEESKQRKRELAKINRMAAKRSILDILKRPPKKLPTYKEAIQTFQDGDLQSVDISKKSLDKINQVRKTRVNYELERIK